MQKDCYQTSQQITKKFIQSMLSNDLIFSLVLPAQEDFLAVAFAIYCLEQGFVKKSFSQGPQLKQEKN